MAGVTLDAGALIAAERDDVRFWTRWKDFVREDIVMSVPAPVVAQVWRGAKSARIGAILKCCRETPFGASVSKQVGTLCAAAGASDVVDAFVVLDAASRGDDILTSDPDDLHVLAGHVRGLGKIKDITSL